MRPHIALVLVGLTPVVLLAPACGADNPTVGQSGSEFLGQPDPQPPVVIPPGIPGPSHCPCGQLGGEQAIRATVTATEAFPEVGVVRYTLQADALLSAASPDDEIGVGDSFGGYWNRQLPCGGEAEFGIGDAVVAFFRRGEQDRSQCCERVACIDEAGCRELAEPGEDQGDLAETEQAACERSCTDETAAACAEHHQEAIGRGELTLLGWGETLTVGTSEHGEAVISAEQLSVIGQPECSDEVPDGYAVLYPPEPEQEPDPDTDTELSGDQGASPPVPPSEAQPPPRPAPPAENPANMPMPDRAPAGSVASPPPAHPEEIRVRCAQ